MYVVVYCLVAMVIVKRGQHETRTTTGLEMGTLRLHNIHTPSSSWLRHAYINDWKIDINVIFLEKIAISFVCIRSPLPKTPDLCLLWS